MAAREWIRGDESAKEMLSRVLTARPLLLVPPLHRVPLRVGNVVEIVGPSPSAKSEILIQARPPLLLLLSHFLRPTLHAAISCVLPKEWKGVDYGGLEQLVIFLDLDCRFDVLRLSQSLKHRIVDYQSYLDEELFRVCMKRLIYVRCYNSFEFLAALKTLHFRLEKEMELQGVLAHLLMIDSINAFYWADRASKPLALDGSKRKNFSLQTVTETVVLEIRKLLQVHPLLVLATKGKMLGVGGPSCEMKKKWSLQDSSMVTSSNRGTEKFVHDYMPSAWQQFVTHRVSMRISDESFADGRGGNLTIYASEWILPSLNVFDKFTVKDAGIFIVT